MTFIFENFLEMKFPELWYKPIEEIKKDINIESVEFRVVNFESEVRPLKA